MEDLIQAMRDVVVANRILARENVVDAYGHVSIRHPTNPDRYILSCSRSPELVALDDLMEFTLDGDAVDGGNKVPYAERFIHGAIYEERPDVMSVVHNHSHDVIPFGITDHPLRPVVHVGSSIGSNIPKWDIRDKFGDTNLLVVNMEQGRDLAQALDQEHVVLMRGHGCAVTGHTIKASVMRSIYLQVNARLQLQTMLMGGEINYMTPGEIDHCIETQLGELSTDRAWQYFRTRAGMADF